MRDPRTREIRYVGKTTQGMRRPRDHMRSGALSKDHTHKGCWIRLLIKEGLTPEIIILETAVCAEVLNTLERQWIRIGRAALGKRLTNLTEGGEGALGLEVSVSTRLKHSDARKREWADPEIRNRRLSAALSARRTPEVSAKVSAKQKEVWQRSEHRALVSTKQKITKATPEYKSKFRAARKVVTDTPEYHVRAGIAARQIWSRPGYRERRRAAKQRRETGRYTLDGRLLQAFRAELGLSLRRAAEFLGVTRVTYTSREKGKYGPVRR